MYIAAASSLIASVVFVYFAAVFPQVSVCSRSVHVLWQKTCFPVLISCLCLQILASNSRLVAAGHLVSGLFCLLNIIFNYVQCVITDPGSPEILDTSVSTRTTAFSSHTFLTASQPSKAPSVANISASCLMLACTCRIVTCKCHLPCAV